MNSDDFYSNRVEVLQDPKDPTRYHFTYSSNTIQLTSNKSDSLFEQMCLSVIGKMRGKGFTQEEVDVVVNITCNIAPWMVMNFAVEILDSGLAHDYVAKPEIRPLIDIWAKTNYAGLSLKEFLNNASNES